MLSFIISHNLNDVWQPHTNFLVELVLGAVRCCENMPPTVPISGTRGIFNGLQIQLTFRLCYRWRSLGRPTETSKEVQRKVDWLTEQLSLKNERLRQKSLLLGELDDLAAHLTQQAAIAQPEALHLYKEVSYGLLL